MAHRELQLLPGEQVLWEGAPPTGLRFYKHDAGLISFHLCWVGFVSAWNYGVWAVPNNWFMRLWGVPFMIYGAYLLIGRFLIDTWIRRHQSYFVTNKRALIVTSGWRGGVRSVNLEAASLVDLKEQANGFGDLRLGPTYYFRGRSGALHEKGRMIPALSPTPQFIGIPKVAAVLRLIERTPSFAHHQPQVR